MTRRPEDRGLGWVEWVLIIILVIMVLLTAYLLLRPALSNFLQDFLESVQ